MYKKKQKKPENIETVFANLMPVENRCILRATILTHDQKILSSTPKAR